MVFIFVTPRARGRPERQVVSVDKSVASIRNGSGQELRADHADEGVHNHLAPGSIASPMTSEAVTEAGAGELDLTSSGVIVPRRTRSRARKAAKPATEHVLEAALPTWVRSCVQASLSERAAAFRSSIRLSPRELLHPKVRYQTRLYQRHQRFRHLPIRW